MPTVRARIVSPPELLNRDTLAFSPNASGATAGVFIRGSGTTSYVCGLCGTVLVEKVFHGQVRNVLLECPKCRSYNEIP